MYWREQRKNRKEAINAKRRKWREEHPQPAAAQRTWINQDVLDEYGTDCHICGKAIRLDAPSKVGVPGWELGFHPDHVIPLSKGGEDVLENLRPAHAYCNQRKWATAPAEMAEQV